MSLLTPPIYEANGVRASDVKTLLESGAAPRRLDPAGVAALLWRGAAMGARLPVVGVRRISPPGPSTSSELARPPHTNLEEFRAALATAEGESGENGSVPAEDLTVEGFDRRRLEAMDMPSIAGLGVFSSGDLHESVVGRRELFGRDELFRRFATGSGRRRSRPRPGGDPLDAAAQREREVHAFAEVDAQRLHALSAVLPAATRAALSRTGPRPPDGIDPGTTRLALASDLLRRGVLVDGDLVALEAIRRSEGREVRCPFLHPDVVAAARGLDPEVRFGKPGSGGPFASAGMARMGPTFPERAARGPLAAFIDTTLTRDRVAAQGVLVPDAVTEALGRFHRGEAGWTGEAILLLALLTDWIERNGLSLETRA